MTVRYGALIACLLFAGCSSQTPQEPPVDILIGDNAVMLFNIDQKSVETIAQTYRLDAPDQWRVYGNTAEEKFVISNNLNNRAKRHKEWDGNPMTLLLDYKVCSRKIIDKQEVALLYSPDSKILIIFMGDVLKDSDIPEGKRDKVE